jgi:hypothetical protein
MAAVTVATPVRPVRGLVLVPQFTDVDWRITMTAALRAQAAVWGGQGNIPVPCTNELLENPLFWSICTALDPDAVLVHPGYRTDLKDLVPDVYGHQMQARRQALTGQFEEQVVAADLARYETEPLTTGPLPDNWGSVLCERGAFFNHNGAPELTTTQADGKVGWPFVSASASDLLAPASTSDERTARDEAADFLRAELESGPVAVKTLQARAHDAGLNWRTVERAKTSICKRAREDGSHWVWELKSATPSTPSVGVVGVVGLERGKAAKADKTVKAADMAPVALFPEAA